MDGLASLCLEGMPCLPVLATPADVSCNEVAVPEPFLPPSHLNPFIMVFKRKFYIVFSLLQIIINYKLF